MAKKKGAGASSGAEGAESDAPKSKKKLIIMITVIVMIGGFAGKTILLKPKPLTAAQIAAAADAADAKLANLCASHNNLPTTPLPTDAHSTENASKSSDSKSASTTTTLPDAAGPVDSLDAITINLAAGHYLKVGLALQVPAGVVPDDVKKTENWEAVALKTAIDRLSGQTIDTLSGQRQADENAIGNDVCRKTEGKVLTIYFTDFVMQ